MTLEEEEMEAAWTRVEEKDIGGSVDKGGGGGCGGSEYESGLRVEKEESGGHVYERGGKWRQRV